MKQIFKYPIPISNKFLIELPKGATIIAAQVQHERLCLWAVVDIEENEKVLRTIRVIGTGNPFPDADSCVHISTFQMDGGHLVFHLFEQN